MEDAYLKKVRRLGSAINMLASVSPRLAGKITYRIFCGPRRMKLQSKDVEFLNKARYKTLQLAGYPVQLYCWPADQPDARTVLFLHGWESTSARWRRFIKTTHAAGFRIVAFDAPAHGFSGGSEINLPLYSRAIADYVQAEGVPYAMVGHSLGGAAIIMSMAAYEVPRVHQAVVMGAFAESTRVLQSFGDILGANQRVRRAVADEIHRRGGMPIEAFSVVEKASILRDVEGLVIHDLNDEVAPVAEGRAIAEAWGARYVETSGLGHKMQAKSVADIIVEFLRVQG